MERPEQPPAEIAREAIRLLATRRLAPTPDNYRRAYAEVSGGEERPEPAWAEAIRPLIKQWDAHQSGLTRVRKREMLERVLINFGQDARLLHEKLSALARSWAAGATEAADAAEATDAEETAARVAAAVRAAPCADAAGDCRPLVQSLAGNFELLAHACEPRWPDLAQRAGRLARGVQGRAALTPAQFEEWTVLWREVLIRAEDNHELSSGLKRLVGLLFLNIGELVGDEDWLAGQLAAMQNAMAGNLEPQALLEAERSLRELAYKQGVLKGSLDEAKQRLKTLVTTFIDRVGEMSRSADGYHSRIGAYSEKISHAADLSELGDVVQGLSSDVAGMRDDLRNSHRELVDARSQAEQAEKRIQDLQRELAQVSNLVREDQLTGALNRRGMDEAFKRELSRSARLHAPFSIGLLDIDHFKKLNDRLGHQAGDEALRHLTRVIRGLLRPTDTLARYGGEEFLILLPNTDITVAEEALKRIQRELTRQFFMHGNDRILITFSAGVATLGEGETEAEIIARADAAMYRAKSRGRNRVEQG